jgi:mannosyltransferase
MMEQSRLDAVPVTDAAFHEPSQGVKKSRRQLLSFFAPALIILGSMIGVVLIDYFFLMHQSLRLDESQSLWQSSHTIRGLLRAVAIDVHVPLYHLILHFWIFFFGDSITRS